MSFVVVDSIPSKDGASWQSLFVLYYSTIKPVLLIQSISSFCIHSSFFFPVPLESSKSALEYVKEYLGTHEQAQQFVEQYMDGLVETILSRESPEEESDESHCIEECLKLSTVIIVKNMDLQLKENGTLETTSTILTNLFCKDSKYYQENEGNRTRYKVIDVFHVHGGFSSLAEYIASQQYCHVIACDRVSRVCRAYRPRACSCQGYA